MGGAPPSAAIRFAHFRLPTQRAQTPPATPAFIHILKSNYLRVYLREFYLFELNPHVIFESQMNKSPELKQEIREFGFQKQNPHVNLEFQILKVLRREPLLREFYFEL